MTRIVLRPHTTYDRTQNVHDNERIKQYYSAVSVILTRVDTPRYNTQKSLMESITNVIVMENKQKVWWKRLSRSVKYTHLVNLLNKWTRDQGQVDKLYNLSLFDLMVRIWTLVEDEKCETEYLSRLHLEVQDVEPRDGLCFTGRVLRVINACVGLIPGVVLRLSVYEDLNNKAIVLLRSRKSDETNEEFVKRYANKMYEYLEESQVHDEYVRDAYLTCELSEDKRTHTVETSV